MKKVPSCCSTVTTSSLSFRTAAIARNMKSIRLLVSGTLVELAFAPQTTLINTWTAPRQHTGATVPYLPPVLHLPTRPQRRSETGISTCEHVRIISTSSAEEKGLDVGRQPGTSSLVLQAKSFGFQVNGSKSLVTHLWTRLKTVKGIATDVRHLDAFPFQRAAS